MKLSRNKWNHLTYRMPAKGIISSSSTETGEVTSKFALVMGNTEYQDASFAKLIEMFLKYK